MKKKRFIQLTHLRFHVNEGSLNKQRCAKPEYILFWINTSRIDFIGQQASFKLNTKWWEDEYYKYLADNNLTDSMYVIVAGKLTIENVILSDNQRDFLLNLCK